MDVTDVPNSAPTTHVPVSACARRPDNPRPKATVVDELASTIREFGQLQPATIASRAAYLEHRPEHADAIGNAEWVVLYGNRRHLALEQVGIEHFLVHVADDRVAEVIETGIIENIQREPLLPVREAQELLQLYKRYGKTRVVAQKIGKTHVYVSQRLSLLDLLDELQETVDEGRLSITNARELAKLPPEQQLEAYKAGPPYKKPAEPPHQEVPPPEALDEGATSDVGAQPSRQERPTPGNDVSNQPAPTPSRGNRSEDVPVARPAAVQTSASGAVGNDVSNQLPEPSTLVRQMRLQYTEDQIQETVKLLIE